MTSDPPPPPPTPTNYTPFRPPTDLPGPEQVITSTGSSKPKFNKKLIIAIALLFVLGSGVITAIVLVQRRQRATSYAWDCSKYVFSVSQTGLVTATNGSNRNEPNQRVDVYIDNALVNTFDAPDLAPGATANLGTVTVPPSGVFSWKVDGQSDCLNTGSYLASCQVIFNEADKLYCDPNQNQVAVTGTVVSAPENSTLQTAYYIVNPPDLRTEQTYASQPASNNLQFSITATWPGIRPTDTTVEIHYGAAILDSNGNPIANCTGSLDYYWTQTNAGSCNNPTSTPTSTPMATATPGITTSPTTTPLPTTTPIPTLTITPTPGIPDNTPGSPNKCNGTCGSNANCEAQFICSAGRCRNPNCSDQMSCACPPAWPTPKLSPTPAQLAQSGSTTNTWVVTIGSSILIALGVLLAL